MLVGLGGTSWLGLWQYSVAHRGDLADQVANLPEVELTAITAIGSYLSESDYGREVSVSGRLDCSLSFTVGEAEPHWLVCPLWLADGSAAAVVLGAIRGVPPGLPAAADLTLTGRVQPSQDTSAAAAIYPAPAPSHVDLIGTAELTQRWQSDVRDGFVVVSAQTSEGLGLESIPSAAIAFPPAGIEFRNLFYAWQWWLFAAFTVFIWGRYLRDEWRLAGAPESV